MAKWPHFVPLPTFKQRLAAPLSLYWRGKGEWGQRRPEPHKAPQYKGNILVYGKCQYFLHKMNVLGLFIVAQKYIRCLFSHQSWFTLDFLFIKEVAQINIKWEEMAKTSAEEFCAFWPTNFFHPSLSICFSTFFIALLVSSQLEVSPFGEEGDQNSGNGSEIMRRPPPMTILDKRGKFWKS